MSWIFKGSTGSNWWQCRLVVDLTGQNIANNTSTLNFTFQICRTNYENYGISDGGTTYSISADGGTTGTRSFNCQIAAGTAGNGNWRTIGSSWSSTIAHNSNGTKTISCSASWTLPTASPRWASVGTSWIDLPTIPRTSSVSGGTGNIGAAATINISRASSGFTHNLYYSFGSIGKTLIASGVGSSYSWTIPTSFYAQMPNSINGNGTIYCDTYSGSSFIGASTCGFTASVILSNPTVSASIYDSNATTTALTGNNQVFVKGYSNAYVSITATAKNSATITSRSVSCGDGQHGSSTTQTLNKVASGNFSVACRDSRGLLGSASYTRTLLAYITPGFKTLLVERTSSTSTTVKLASMTGQFWNSNFGSVANTLTVTCQYAASGSASWSTVQTLNPTKNGNNFSLSNVSLSGSFALNKTYNFKFTITDKLTTSTLTKTITVALPIIDIGRSDVKFNGDIRLGGDGGICYPVIKASHSADGAKIIDFLRENGTKLAYLDAELKGEGVALHIYDVAGTWKNCSQFFPTHFNAGGGIKCDDVNVAQYGSNANGEYVRFYDGTQICWKTAHCPGINVTNAWGSMYESTSTLSLGPWPVQFKTNTKPVVSTPSNTNSTSGIMPAVFSTTSTNGGGGWVVRGNPASNVTYNMAVIAIGRWK